MTLPPDSPPGTVSAPETAPLPAPSRPWLSLLPLLAVVGLMPVLAGGNDVFMIDGGSAQLVWTTLTGLLFAGLVMSRPNVLFDRLRRRATWPLALFGLWMLLALPLATLVDPALRFTSIWLSAWLVPWLLLLWNPDARQRTWIYQVLFISGVLTALFAFYQIFWKFPSLLTLPDLNPEDRQLVEETRRPFAFFNSPNVLAGFLLALFPLGGLWLRNASSRTERSLVGLGLGVLLAALFLTGSRGAWIIFLFALVVAAGIWGKRLSRSGRRALCLLLLGGSLLLVGAGFLLSGSDERYASPVERLTSLSTDATSLTGRLSYWQTSLHMAWRNLPLGAGAGSFPYVSRIYQLAPDYSRSPHSFPLRVLAELGLPALIGLLLILWPLFKRKPLPKNPEEAAERIMLDAALAVLFLHGMIDMDFDAPALLGLFLALWALRIDLTSPSGRAELPPVGSGRAVVASLVALAFPVGLFLGLFFPLMGDKNLDLAEAASESNSNDQAISLIEKSIAVWPYNAAAHYRLGMRLLARNQGGDLSRGTECFRQALALDPFSPEFYLGMADAMAAGGEPNAAKEYVRKAAQFHPTSIHYATESAKSLALLGDMAGALDRIEAALELETAYLERRNPNGSDLLSAHLLRAAILADMQRFGEARAECDRVVELCRHPGIVLHSFSSNRKVEGGCEEIDRRARGLKESITRMEMVKTRPDLLPAPREILKPPTKTDAPPAGSPPNPKGRGASSPEQESIP